MRVGWTLATAALVWATIIGAGLSACSSKSAAGSPDASADSPTLDAIVRPDQSQVDTGAGEDSNSEDAGCAPVPVDAAFPFVPPNPPRSLCTVAQIQALYNACWNGGTATCDAFYGDPSNSPCIACMLTPSSETSWGAVVEYPDDITYTNGAGCIALTFADAGGLDCGTSIQANERCSMASCSSYCPSGSTAAGLAEFQQCQSESQTTTCATQYQAADTCFSDPTYTPCVFADFEASFIGLGEFFCAAGAADGGADAPSDAPADGG